MEKQEKIDLLNDAISTRGYTLYIARGDHRYKIYHIRDDGSALSGRESFSIPGLVVEKPIQLYDYDIDHLFHFLGQGV